MLRSKDKDEMVECDNGESYRAIDLKEKAKDVVKDMSRMLTRFGTLTAET